MRRRIFLKGAAAFGCSAAAHPLTTTMTFAAVPGEARLVVIILRGAMDGLDVLRPVGDAAFAALRPGLHDGTLALGGGGRFGMHPALGPLLPLWEAGELGFAHAVSTPYRDKRSHFDGQDVLEAGTGRDVPEPAVRDGWLNRMLQAMPGVAADTAYAIGREALPVLEGAATVRNWSPEVTLALSAQNRLLLETVYHGDALFRDAGEEALTLAAENGTPASDAKDVEALADFAAARLRGETRIAAFSQTGWDTHRAQARTLPKALDRLATTVLRLKAQLGPVWAKTTVLAMTEFGRTARENGSGGTDHGTGGVLLMAGGAVQGGRVLGRWPGLAEADLYEGRDLFPTADVRAHAAWAMRGLYGLDRGLLERTVFPGLDMGDDPGLLR